MGSFLTAGTLQGKNKSDQQRSLVAMTINNAVLQSTMKCWDICHQLALYPRDTNTFASYNYIDGASNGCTIYQSWLTHWHSASGANQWAVLVELTNGHSASGAN